jgi:hypothetical protein
MIGEFADRAAAALGVVPAASLTLVSDAPARTVAASDPLAVRLDAVQYGEDAGPCLEAARRGGPAGVVGDSDDRWPVFARALVDAGCDSVWSHPLPLQGATAGSLNVYLPEGVAPDRRTTAAVLAEGAVLPLTNVWLYEEALRTSEESRAVIEQAKGILMERLKVTADRAFDVLARISNDTNTKLRDVAQTIVDTGSVPPGATPRRSPASR